MNRFIYFIALFFVSIIRALPLRCCFRLGQLLGWIAWVILPGYRHLTRKNLTIAFGEKHSCQQLQRWTRESFMMLGANILSSLKMPSMKEAAIHQTFTFEGEQYWHQFVDSLSDQGTVAALNHFGNWELNAQAAICLQGRAAGTIYQPLRNRFIDDLINRDRRSRGVTTFDRRKELSAATSLLRQGGLLGVLTDQHAGDAGIWIPFFNKLASTSPLAATLAQKTEAALLPITIRTVGIARWIIHIHPPIETKDRNIGDITYDLGEALAQEIQRSPTDWFWVHNRWKLPKPAFLLSRTRRGYFLPAGQSPAQLQKLKLLVRVPNWLGDACMTAPAIRALKAGRPDLDLTILTPSKLADLWKEIPEVDNIIVIPPKASPWKVAALLKQQSTHPFLPAFDAALLFPNSIRSALEVWLAKIPRRIGRVGKKGKARRWLINQAFPKEIEEITHERDQYLAVARWLGAPVNIPPAPTTDGQEPSCLLHKKHTSSSASSRKLRIAIAPGAEYGPAKRWPANRFRAVMDQLSAQHEIEWFLLGTAAERPIAAEILAGKFEGHVHNKMGETSLAELISLLKECDLLLTNDTGTMHLANAFNLPLVALFGSTDPTKTGPQGQHHLVLQYPVSCNPCFLRTCPIDFPCMLGIKPEAVVKAIEKLLDLEAAKTSS